MRGLAHYGLAGAPIRPHYADEVGEKFHRPYHFSEGNFGSGSSSFLNFPALSEDEDETRRIT
jgi:hypothetical protein